MLTGIWKDRLASRQEIDVAPSEDRQVQHEAVAAHQAGHGDADGAHASVVAPVRFALVEKILDGPDRVLRARRRAAARPSSVFTGCSGHVDKRKAHQPHADLDAQEIVAGRVERQRHAGPADVARLPVRSRLPEPRDEARRHQPFDKVGHRGTGQRQAPRDLGARQAALAAQQASGCDARSCCG